MVDLPGFCLVQIKSNFDALGRRAILVRVRVKIALKIFHPVFAHGNFYEKKRETDSCSQSNLWPIDCFVLYYSLLSVCFRSLFYFAAYIEAKIWIGQTQCL